MRRAHVVAIAALTLVAPQAGAQAPQEDVRITTEKVAGDVYMLQGQGGNIGLCVGDDGVLMIDDQFAPLTGKILAAVAELSDQPVRFVLNTHWHFDHVGGNENLGKAGAVIVAHDNVRTRMGSEQFMAAFDMRVPPSPKVALPVVTFADSLSFHLNGEEIQVFHVENAHTDGDAIVHFQSADVIHMGDTFFNGMYPFIDVGSGGSIDGVIAAADRILALAGERTRLIPGHGPVAGRETLRACRDRLASIRADVQKLIDAGKGRSEVIAAKPTARFDQEWGGGFLTPDVFVGIVFDSLTGD